MPIIAKSLQSCPTLCDPIDGSPPGSPVPGILQTRTLEWVAISLLQCMKVKSESEVAQSCLTLGDPMDCSLPVSSVHGIFQARVLEWVAIAFSSTSLLPQKIGKRQTILEQATQNMICGPVLATDISTAIKGKHLETSRANFGEGNGTPLQYSCLENPMDGGAWWAAVHGVTKSRT